MGGSLCAGSGPPFLERERETERAERKESREGHEEYLADAVHSSPRSLSSFLFLSSLFSFSLYLR